MANASKLQDAFALAAKPMPQARCAVPPAPFPLLRIGKGGEKLILMLFFTLPGGVKNNTFFLFPALAIATTGKHIRMVF